MEFLLVSALMLAFFRNGNAADTKLKSLTKPAHNLNNFNLAAREITDVSTLNYVQKTGFARAHEELYKEYYANISRPTTAFNQPNERSLDIAHTGLTNSFALASALEKYGENEVTLDAKGQCVPVTGFCKVNKICDPVETQVTAKCDAKKAFRNEDGSCHDLRKANLGMAGTTQERLVPNRYSDGCDIPRKFSLVDGQRCSPLPSARTVSVSLSQSARTPAKNVSILLTTFGQFVDHDMTMTPMFHRKAHNRRPVMPLCCPFKTSSQCDAMAVSKNDPFYSDYGVSCLDFVRSVATTTDPSCGLGVRLQINQNTHWLDGSNIYGSGGTQSAVLRSNDSGSMDAINVNGGGKRLTKNTNLAELFPPLSNIEKCRKHGTATINAPCSEDECCVYAGDVRAGEQAPLVSMHALWLRQHITVAFQVYRQHTEKSDEEIFQRTRRIVLAQYQHIVFHELLPEILGKRRMEQYELNVLNGSKFLPADKYQPGLGKIFLEFSTAAGRFGHSLLHDNVYKTPSPPSQFHPPSSYSLSDHLNKIYLALSDETDTGSLLKGQCSHAALRMDQQITGEVQNKLFKGSSPFGNDLFATNVQRGRDHGIGTYYDLRKYCLGDVSVDPSWDSPVWENVFYTGVLQIMKKLYKSPLDVDLFAGGISETPDPVLQGLVGPTFGCIIAKQFHATKFGDRFYYEFEKLMNKKSQFTLKQMVEIRKTSLARLMCDVTDIVTVQPKVFRTDSKTVSCSDEKFMEETDVNYYILAEDNPDTEED